MTFQEFIKINNLNNLDDLVDVIKEKGKELPVNFVYQAAEYLNPNRDLNAAYYTDNSICEYIFKELPVFEGKDHVRILEPSAGAGNFLPFIAEKYQDKKILEIYLIDIDENQLKIAELIFNTYYREKYPNVALVYIHDDYLKFTIDCKKFDLVIGNPPFAKVTNSGLLKQYRKSSLIKKSANLFVWFLEKAIKDGDWVSLIVPKSFLNAPEYVEIRNLVKSNHIHSILDFGENGFKGVKIETINLLITSTLNISFSHIKSITQNLDITQAQHYIADEIYPVWLLYRNSFFDQFASTMRLGVFETFRDRQIVNKMVSNHGKYRVLKSRNIVSNGIINLDGYDTYIDDIKNLAVAKFLNKKYVVLVPNLSYSPRACFLPPNSIANGSVALLTLKDENMIVTALDLALYATPEFSEYYKIARNYGTRSLNIDNNSVFFFGLRR